MQKPIESKTLTAFEEYLNDIGCHYTCNKEQKCIYFDIRQDCTISKVRLIIYDRNDSFSVNVIMPIKVDTSNEKIKAEILNFINITNYAMLYGKYTFDDNGYITYVYDSICINQAPTSEMAKSIVKYAYDTSERYSDGFLNVITEKMPGNEAFDECADTAEVGDALYGALELLRKENEDRFFDLMLDIENDEELRYGYRFIDEDMIEEDDDDESSSDLEEDDDNESPLI